MSLSGDWPYQDWPSVVYTFDGSEGEDLFDWEGHEDQMRMLLERRSAASLALLVTASTKAQDPGQGDIHCPTGTHYEINQGCVNGPPQTFSPLPEPDLPFLIATEPVDGDGGTCGAYASCTSASECAPDEACTSGCCTPIVK